MNPTAIMGQACEDVPGLTQAALVLLPDGLCLAGLGTSSLAELEPAIRATSRCFAPPRASEATAAALTECVLILGESLVVLARGRRDPRLALVVTCARIANLALLQQSTRAALRQLEDAFDLAALGVVA